MNRIDKLQCVSKNICTFDYNFLGHIEKKLQQVNFSKIIVKKRQNGSIHIILILS